MYRKLIFFIGAFILFTSCGGPEENNAKTLENKLSNKDREEILTTFLSTQDSWNRGDIEEFMSSYWKSEKLTFTGVGGPTYGYKATLKRYKASYPDKETMGILKFNVIDLYQVDNSTALMIGKFYLSRKMGDLVGHFTLVWQKIDGKWLIISDHSSGQELE